MNDLPVGPVAEPNELSRAPVVLRHVVRSGAAPLSAPAIEHLARYFRILLEWDQRARMEIPDRTAA